MTYLMGIDVATSGVKTIIITPDGTMVGEGFETYPTSTPNPGWVEQDPHDWWRSTAASIRRALDGAGIDPGAIAGIGLSGQMHGATFLNADGEPLRPCLIWADTRTGPQCERLERLFGHEKLVELTCNPALASFTATKIMWVQEHQPEVFAATHKVLLPKDYVRFKLTGAYATELSDASGTSLLDVRNRRWSSAMLEGLEIPASMMPDVYESSHISGRISKAAAAETHLAEGTPVVGGAGDVAAGAVGSGATRSGIVTIIMGSGGIVFAGTDAVVMDKANAMQTCCHAVENMWHVMGVMLSCSFSLRYFKETFADVETAEAERTGANVYKLLDAQAATVPPGSEGLIFLPYLNGERTPHRDPYARGAFVGLTLRHKRPHYVRAVMEGVAYGLRDALEIVRDMGTEVAEVRAVGGGASSPLWRQILADTFGCPVATINVTEASALGVALLAGAGTGVYDSVPDGCDRTIRLTSTTEPIAANTTIYDGYYQRFRALYPALKPQFRELAEYTDQVGNGR
ncbi:MAG: xylulokinase [Planctomycetota bacterium]